MDCKFIELNIDWLKENSCNIRLHGNRFIQIDLDQVGDERIHIWSDFLPPGQMIATPIHNHKFSFTSTILSGCLVEMMYSLDKDLWGGMNDRFSFSYDIYEAVQRHQQDTELIKVGADYRVNVSEINYYLDGRVYNRDGGNIYHATGYIGYAITYMQKREVVKGARPLVLCPSYLVPDNSFNRYQYTTDGLWNTVEKILKNIKSVRLPFNFLKELK